LSSRNAKQTQKFQEHNGAARIGGEVPRAERLFAERPQTLERRDHPILVCEKGHQPSPGVMGTLARPSPSDLRPIIQTGYDPFLSERSLKPPVFHTSTFVFRSAQDGKESSSWHTAYEKSAQMRSPD
jgi:hypothetical protein